MLWFLVVSIMVGNLVARHILLYGTLLPLYEFHIISREQTISAIWPCPSPPTRIELLNIGDDVVRVKGDLSVISWKSKRQQSEEFRLLWCEMKLPDIDMLSFQRNNCVIPEYSWMFTSIRALTYFSGLTSKQTFTPSNLKDIPHFKSSNYEWALLVYSHRAWAAGGNIVRSLWAKGQR